MTGDYFDRLRSTDPARTHDIDVAAIRSRVDALTSVAQSPARTQKSPRLIGLAAATALVMSSGGGYFLGQRASNVEVTSAQAVQNFAGASGANVSGDAVGGEMRSAIGGYGGWYGNTVLKPASSLSNVPGEARAYAFEDDSLDRVALARALATSLGLDASLVKEQADGYVGFMTNDGISVGQDQQAQFWGNNSERNPWTCGVSPDGSSVVSEADQLRAQSECDARWPRPSNQVALEQAEAVISKLGFSGRFGYSVSWGDVRSVTVVVTREVEGMPIRGGEISLQIGAKGIYSVNGAGARIVPASNRIFAGAREVAERSAWRKWSTFGPFNITPNPADGAATTFDNPGRGGAPTTTKRGNLLLPPAFISEIDVTEAKRGLQLVWFPGGEVLLLPAWDYTASDGSVWQMLALRDEAIDWSMQVGGAMPAVAERGVAP